MRLLFLFFVIEEDALMATVLVAIVGVYWQVSAIDLLASRMVVFARYVGHSQCNHSVQLSNPHSCQLFTMLAHS